MALRLRLHLLPARGKAFHFLLRPGSVIPRPGVLPAMVKADWPAAFPRLARATEKGSRQVVDVSFVARSSPELGHFAFVLCRWPIRFAIADLVIAAADPFFPVRSDLAAAVGSVGFAAGSVVAVGPFVVVDSAAIVFAAAGPGFAVAADLVCSAGSVCSFSAAKG